jgi:hypothetical protein
MQSILGSITTGASRSGIRAVVAGQEKIGKTTFCTGAPGALLVPLEVGFAGVTGAKTSMLQTLEEVWQFNSEVIALAQRGQFPYRSIVYDSSTALERHIHDYVLKQDPLYKPNSPKKSVTMDSAHGGYGKAYNFANDYFNGILQQFDQMAIYGGLNIILTCHVFASKVVDPTAGEYDSWDLLLHSPKNQKTYGKREALTQWADFVGFLYEPVFISQANEKSIARASSQNKGRVLGLSRTPSYTAGNRFGIMGELSIPAPPANGWNSFAQALYVATGIDLYTR